MLLREIADTCAKLKELLKNYESKGCSEETRFPEALDEFHYFIECDLEDETEPRVDSKIGTVWVQKGVPYIYSGVNDCDQIPEPSETNYPEESGNVCYKLISLETGNRYDDYSVFGEEGEAGWTYAAKNVEEYYKK